MKASRVHLKTGKFLNLIRTRLIEGILIPVMQSGLKLLIFISAANIINGLSCCRKHWMMLMLTGYVGEKMKETFGTDFSCDIYIHKGAGAYICGEESSLMNSLEGKRGYPRVKPPFPAQNGLWGCPTTINNVETITNVPAIINKGWEWFSKIGEPKHPGTILYGISGHVNKPGVYELPSGTFLLI